jgi:ethanolamine kinase
VLPTRLDPAAPDLDAAALAVVRQALPAWERATAVTVRPLPGGITNALLRLTTPDQPDVLVRVYGPETERVIDRDRENRLFAALSARGMAPPYLGRFENGRVEGFLEGFRSLEPAELGAPRWQGGIAVSLAAFHALSPAELLGEAAPARTFDTLRGWLDEARRARLSGDRAARHAALRLDRCAATLDRLQAAYTGGAVAGPAAATRTVLAHNDLLSGNILVEPATGAVRFIDFEYGDAGIAAFDVANHFCEYAGFDSDFARRFPSSASRRAFLARYLGAPADGPDVVAFDDLVRFFVLVDHLWWGAWAVVQAAWSPIDFDFLTYAEARLAGLAFHGEQWGRLGQG